MRKIILVIFMLINTQVFATGSCYGRFVDPLTDICWSCLFPMTLGATPIYKGKNPDTKNPRSPVCYCQKGEFPQVGLSVGFWEPARMVDVTRTPYCFPTLNGATIKIGNITGEGDVGLRADMSKHSFYQAHWFVYPLLTWLNIISDAMCLEGSDFDLAYMTEIDPTWRDESLGFILNPEAALFSSLPAQAACAADCTAATTHLPIDSLYWCAGCHGSMYPLTGYVAGHVGGVQASALITERMTFKMHRMGLEMRTAGKMALCYKLPELIMDKSQYRFQMLYPKAVTKSPQGCNPYGRSTVSWQANKEYPTTGEDFGYLIWRKRNCCAM